MRRCLPASGTTAAVRLHPATEERTVTRQERRALDRQQRKLEKKSKRSQPLAGHRAWIAAGALAAYAAVGAGNHALAAVGVAGTAGDDSQVATLPLMRFDSWQRSDRR